MGMREFSAPVDMPDFPASAYMASLQALRQQLIAAGDPRGQLSDADLQAAFSGESNSTMILQPIQNGAGYVYRPAGPSIPLPRPNLIPDDLAVAAIMDGNQNLEVPLTFSPNDNAMRRKMSYPSTFSAFPRNISALSAMPITARIAGTGPILVKSLGQLNAFSAFADAASDQALSDQVEAGLNDPTASQETDYTAYTPATPATSGGVSFGSQLLSSLPSLLTAGVGAARTLNGQPAPVVAPVAQTTSNMTTLLLLGGGALVLFMVLGRKKV